MIPTYVRMYTLYFCIMHLRYGTLIRVWIRFICASKYFAHEMFYIILVCRLCLYGMVPVHFVRTFFFKFWIFNDFLRFFVEWWKSNYGSTYFWNILEYVIVLCTYVHTYVNTYISTYMFNNQFICVIFKHREWCKSIVMVFLYHFEFFPPMM